MSTPARKVQIHFDNDEVLTLETAQISLTDPVTGEQTNVRLTDASVARTDIEHYEKRKRENEKHTGQENTNVNRPA